MKRLIAISLVFLMLAAAAMNIGRSSAKTAAPTFAPTFAKDVAPIIFNKCANCHRPGEVAPMSLTSYAEVRPWSKAIREEIAGHTMPPWFADPQTSTLHFANDRRLSEQEIKTILDWVDAGAPKGDDKDLPAMPKYAAGWTFGEPDLVIEMPIDFEVPAEGELPMQNFYVPVPFSEERWVEKVELRPGNPAVVHHSIANVVALPPGTKIVNGKAVSGTAADAALRARLRTRFEDGGGHGDAAFARWLGEHAFDLHYRMRPGAMPFAFARGELSRLAVQHPGAATPACIHRAPAADGHTPRLLLIS